MAGYKVNSNKSVAYLYMKDNWAEKEIMEVTAFTITTNSVRNCGVILIKHVKVWPELQVTEEKHCRRCQKRLRSFMITDQKMSEDGKLSHAHGSVELTQ